MKEPSTGYRKRGVDYDIGNEMYTLPGKYYHSPQIFQEELNKIFYSKWLFACRKEELPSSGDYVLIPVGEESIILVCDESGILRAHFNVCRHRGTRICQEISGHFKSGRIKCPYHAWQYDLEGKLRGAPLMHEVHNFNKLDFSLHSVAVEIWEGFVFINLSENPEPFENEMGVLAGKFKDWKISDLRIARKIEYRLKCNWKLIVQNYQECYHCPGVHPLLSQWTPFRNAVHDCMEGSVIGGYMTMSKKGGSMTMDGSAAAPPICEVSGEDLQRVHYYSIFPNLLLTIHPDFVMYHRLRNLSEGQTQNDCFFLLPPEIIVDSRSMERFESAIQFWDKTNLEDWQVCEQMQLGTKSVRFKRGRYSGQEDILYAIDREVLKALGHELM